MSVAIMVNSSPYGSEQPFNALRLAQALELAGEPLDILLMGDAVNTARKGQDPRGAHVSLETLLVDLVEKGARVTLCGTCCQTRGLRETDLVDGVLVGTIHDFAHAVGAGDKVLSF